MNSRSQVGQDLWVLEMLNNKKNGFFIDIGAYDGHCLSNSYMLEKEFEWNGLAIEADPIPFKNMCDIRNCTCINKAITNYNGVCKFYQDPLSGKISDNGIEIEAITLIELFKQYDVPKIIDYISLDIEGGEYDALLGFPFNEYKFLTLTVEHNIYQGNPQQIKNKSDIFDLLTINNYLRIKNNVDDNGNKFEDWYVHNDLVKN